PWFVENHGVACTRPSVCCSNDRSASNRERNVLKPRAVSRVSARLGRVVEEHLRSPRAIWSGVERFIRRRFEPLPKPKNGHQLVVIALGGGEVGYPEPDVVNESSSGQSRLLF